MASHHQAKDMTGYRFNPTNKELLKYLLGFAINKPLPQQYQFMQLVNLYADKEPWEVFDSTNNDTPRYFITQHNKEKEQHVRVKRTVGINGTWKLQGKVNEVFDDKGKLMGYVKNLKYKPHHKKSSNNPPNGEWLMTEYSLYDHYVDPKKIKNRDYVVYEEDNIINQNNEYLEGDEVEEHILAILGLRSETDAAVEEHINSDNQELIVDVLTLLKV
ncbi:hypothetical protein T459_27170 [Capsicum annuum]|uniref:NAC domain-containing protein n=1 Tax=Capsicum annuum TaxID=4072 RepID=A0A2G2YD55_CAPAN|nr:hypothetical protein T459_27170 [Capsicum annuum]